MNKRIRELAEQAYGIDDNKPFHPSALIALEKFAELIVRECADIADFCDQVESVEAVSSVLKRHFGVNDDH